MASFQRRAKKRESASGGLAGDEVACGLWAVNPVHWISAKTKINNFTVLAFMAEK
jgi:hypothetical protein